MTESEVIAALSEGFARGLARAFATAPSQPLRAKRGRRPNRTPHSRPGTPAAAPPTLDPTLPFDDSPVPPIVRSEPLSAEDWAEMEAVLEGTIQPGHYVPGEGQGAGTGVT
jgi:hypothetical protein